MPICSALSRRPIRQTLMALALMLAPAFALHPRLAEACTRVLWNDQPGVMMTGRTMDWAESTQPALWVMPRGMAREGGVPENPAKWTSKYGSVVTSVYDLGAADGVNEKGLAGHMLFLRATDFGPRDLAKPGLLAGLWVQYLLDNYATVAEAVEAMKKIQPVMQEARGFHSTVHVAVEDAGGDSAIFEYVGGKLTVHHGKQYTVMTNDPPYDRQLELLKKYDFRNPNSTTPLPGNVNPMDRFVRATYFRNLLRKPASEREGVAALMSIVRNASVPFDAPYTNDPRFSVYNTEYRTLSDLANGVYFWEYTRSPNVLWVNFKGLRFDAGSPVLKLDPTQANLNGDVTARFQPVPKAAF